MDDTPIKPKWSLSQPISSSQMSKESCDCARACVCVSSCVREDMLNPLGVPPVCVKGLLSGMTSGLHAGMYL